MEVSFCHSRPYYKFALTDFQQMVHLDSADLWWLHPSRPLLHRPRDPLDNHDEPHRQSPPQG